MARRSISNSRLAWAAPSSDRRTARAPSLHEWPAEVHAVLVGDNLDGEVEDRLCGVTGYQPDDFVRPLPLHADMDRVAVHPAQPGQVVAIDTSSATDSRGRPGVTL